jgi:hypothetical protein
MGTSSPATPANRSAILLTAQNVGGAQSNSQVVAQQAALDGWISCVHVLAQQYCPRGRVYLQVVVISPSSGIPIPLWSGYVRAGEGAPSFPCFRTVQGDQIQATFTFGSNTTNATDVFQVSVDYVNSKDELPPAPWIFTEDPFSGPGEIYGVVIPAPAQGHDPALTQIPKFTRWGFKGFGSQLTTSATVNNRQVNFAIVDSGDVEVEGSALNYMIGPSINALIRCTPNGTDQYTESGTELTPTTVHGGIPKGPYPYGINGIHFSAFEVNTRRLDTNGSTGDVWTQSRLEVEEWAGPNP